MEYLVTFYLANKGESKEIFSILPYEAAVYKGNENDVLERVATVLKKSPFFRCCSIMARPAEGSKIFHINNLYVYSIIHFSFVVTNSPSKLMGSRFWELT